MRKPKNPVSRPITVAVATALSLAALLNARPSSALDIGVSITVAPPALPVYEQPPIPEPGYIWTPGYWAWSDDGYYWVPGTWVEPPEEGLLWTPGYWGWDDGIYLWHAGYWGPTIGFYGGVNYGYGYFGRGYEGGYWDRGAFRYNRAYNHFGNDVHITNVYNKTVVYNTTINHVSYNGGRGGIQTRADTRELTAEHEHHVEPIAAQMHQRELAHDNPALRAAENHGRPGIAATSRPGDFQNHVIPSHGAQHVPLQSSAGGAGGAPRPGDQHFQPQQQQHFQNNTPQTVNHAPVPPQHEERAPQTQYHAPVPAAQQYHAPASMQQHEERAPQAQFHAPAPQPQYHAPPQQHEERAPQTQFHAPAPQPQYHAPAPPQQHEERAPQAQFHAPPPPPQQQPQVHAAPPPQQQQHEQHEQHGGPQHDDRH